MSQFPNDGDYDEEAAIKTAMALSIITVHEDDRRRQQRWGILPPSPAGAATSDVTLPQGNLVASRISAPASVPMKRPGSHLPQSNLLQSQKSQPTPKSSPPSGSIARPRPQSNKPQTDTALGLSRPPTVPARPGCDNRTHGPPPLPSVAPNALTSQNVASGSTEGLAIQPPPRSPRSRRQEHTPLSNRSSETSLKDMFDMYDAEPLITLSPPLISSDDFDISALDPFSTKPYQMYGRQIDITGMPPPAYTAEPVNKGISIRNPMFDLQNLSGKSSPTFEQSLPNRKQGALSGQLSGGAATPGGSGQVTPAGVLSVGGSSGSIPARPPASVRLGTPTLTPQPAMAMYPALTNNPFNISASSSSLSSPSSGPDGVPSSSSSSSALSTGSGTRISNTTSTSGDLMDFGGQPEDDPSHEFLSLEMFDPLYSPVPFVGRAAESYETLATVTNDASSTNGDDFSDALEGQSVEGEPIEGLESSSSMGELQDPFEMSALTMVLEKKRAQHAQEQAKRDAILRKKEGEQPKIVATKKKGHVRRNSHLARGQEATYEMLQEFHETADEEIRAFCQMVASVDQQVILTLKQQYSQKDQAANLGLVISTRVKHPPYSNMTVKVVVHTHFINEPVIFTCDLNSSVEHVISHVLLSLSDELGPMSLDKYIIKVHGLTEYMVNSRLGDYEYVQMCLKLDQDIRLILCEVAEIPKTLLRTAEDDKQPVFVPKHREGDVAGMKITRDKMNILMENFYKEVEKLRDSALQNGLSQVQCRAVIQSVKAVCAMLSKIETIDIIKAVQRLQSVTVEKSLRPASPKDREAFVYVSEEGEGICSVVDSDNKRLVAHADDDPQPHPPKHKALSSTYRVNGVSPGLSDIDDLHIALEELTQSVKCLIELYCRTFHTDFRFESATNVVRERKSLCSVRETLILHVASLHRVPIKWRNSYTDFRVVCGLYHGGRKLCNEVSTQTTPCFADSFQETLIWDEWIQFEAADLACLPRETRLVFMLVGVKVIKAGSDEAQKVNTSLGWVALQVFNHKFELAQGSQLLGLWPGEVANPGGTSQSNTEFFNSVLLQVNLPSFDFDVTFPPIGELDTSLQQDFITLHPSDQEQLLAIVSRDPLSRLTPDETEYLWEKRHYLHDRQGALTKVLLAAPNWCYSSLVEMYAMIQSWQILTPIRALELFQPRYADTHVRTMAVKWLRDLPDDELANFLPQLVQALKFESYHNSALARFLLERSVTSIRIAHQLYWQLKEAAEDVRYRKRYQLVFGALLSVVGASMRREFSKQEDLVKMLAAIAEKVKAAKDKEAVLQRELDNMFDFLQQESIHLPINPSMEIVGVDAKSCSYFTSNAFPLKLVLKNVDPRAEPIYTMFKVGDDIRQDMLTMQLISIMDKLWLRDGLDLKIITFRCQATGPKRGLVELVTDSETLRKIQVKHGHGLTGSFKDGTIAEWLQLQNPTELEYHKAVDNFVASCAGYCVATYVLGIGDRHNDNIMIKHSGHMFHIDFGKFLGDAQMFGNIKRDRVPFVLTSDMAYVINGGDRPSHKFQQFIDLCCQAFNILRKHSCLFLNLFSLMVSSGIPGVNQHAAKYVQRSLLPQHTEAESTAIFTRMIEESLKSMSTQINFFFHNLAQMKFSGHNEGALLSFIPKTYSIHTDGKIKNVEVFGYQKRYNPEKYYIYIIKVDRENQRVPSFIFRRYSEFQEFHQKLIVLFPLAKLPALSGKVLLGRTHVKTVAEARKLELEKFLKQLLQLASEISECDLVYTFFHPMLRDEQDIDKTNLHKLKEDPAARPVNRSIQGQVKLSIIYKNDELTLMIMHVKDLGVEGGEMPDPYVKTYLLPDPMKYTKRKTRIVKGTFHPTFNEMLIYRMPLETVRQRILQVTVWNYNALEENDFFGAVHIRLSELDLTKESTDWYKLQTLHQISFS